MLTNLMRSRGDHWKGRVEEEYERGKPAGGKDKRRITKKQLENMVRSSGDGLIFPNIPIAAQVGGGHHGGHGKGQRKGRKQLNLSSSEMLSGGGFRYES